MLVHSRKQERLRGFCQRMSDGLGISVKPAEGPEDLLGCDITTATSSTRPLFDGSLVRPGTHINAIGSNYASKAEVDVETVRRSTLVVVDALESARLEGGDLLPAIDRGLLAWEHVVELGDVVSGRHPGREDESDVTLFKSHGVASEDVVLAHELWKRATEQGVGERLKMLGG